MDLLTGETKGETLLTVPVLCKEQLCAWLSEWLLLPIDWCFDCKLTPLLPLKLSLVYLFNKSHLGPGLRQGWLGFHASGWTGEKNSRKVWTRLQVPGLPLNCPMTLDESLPPLSLESSLYIPSLTQEDLILWFLFQDVQLPWVAAWTAWESPQNSSQGIAMYILIPVAGGTEPPPPRVFLFRGDMPEWETKLLCLFSKFLLTKSLSVDKSNILKISLEVFQVSKINQNQIRFWRRCLLSFRKK